jgi:hypothetical protein
LLPERRIRLHFSVLWFRHLVPFAVLAAVAVGGVTVYQAGQHRLDAWLRTKLEAELAKENLRADIGRMTLDPLRGLVAHECRLYGGPDQTLLLATFDRLRVEVDVSRLLQRQQFVNRVELTDAALALPLDAENPQTGWISLTGLSADVTASGDRFEVRQARGKLEGVPVTLEGTLLKPARLSRPRNRPPGEKREALDLVRDRRQWLDALRAQVSQLDSSDSPRPPRIHIRLSGDLDRPAELQLRARLRGEEFHYRDYLVKELDMTAEWSRGETHFREIRLRDKAGSLTGSARFEPGRAGLSFQFQSTANLPALAGAVRDMPALREFVIYGPDQRLSITGEGGWRPAAKDGSAPASFRMLGRVASGRFATRGVVFDSVAASFFVHDADFNLRDLRLAHESGTLDGEVMRRAGQWRYRVQSRINPKALQPFLGGAEAQRIMDRLDFQEQSTLELEAQGAGPNGAPAAWEHRASLQARQFRYQGEVVHRAEAALSRNAGHLIARDVRLVRPEGEITAAQLTIDETAKTLAIEDLRSSVFPEPVLQCVNPGIVKFVQAYRFTKPPSVRLSGRIGMKHPDPNDFTLDVTTEGDVQATLPDRTVLPLVAPRGQITGQGAQLSLDLQGQVRDGASWQGTTLDQTVAARFLGSFPLVKVQTPAHAWQFFLTGPARARQTVAAATLPVEVAKATVDFRQRRGDLPGPSVQVEADGRLLAPAQLAMLTVRDPATARFQGIFETPKKAATAADQTRWSLAVESEGIVDWDVGGRSLPLEKLAFQAQFRRNRLDIPRATASLMGGTLTGSGEIDRLSTTQDFVAAVQADAVGFGALARLYAPETATSGQLSGGFRVTGRARPENKQPVRLRGSGQATIRDGDIFALPLLGPLSPMLSAVLPGTKSGYSKAREARATFSLDDGLLVTRDFEALTTAFVIKGGGQINFNTEQVNLQARINTRGPTGMLLYPVSRLLEYEARGTTTEPAWKPMVLSLPGKLLPLPDGRRR